MTQDSPPDITSAPAEAGASSARFASPTTILPPFLRILSVLLACGLLAGFGLAFWLEPSPRGYGTHQQLGLPPCSIQFLFGIPCPSCGMTTSFAWLVRGNVLDSLRANLAGTYLAGVCLGLIPWLTVTAWRGRVPHRVVLERRSIGLMLVFVLLALVQWGLRLAVAL